MLLSAVHSERKLAPATTWDVQSIESWRENIWNAISDLADDAVRTAFLAAPPDFLPWDDFQWIDRIIWTVCRKRVRMHDVMAERLREIFLSIRVVHGTRTHDVARFYREGLTPLVPEHFHKQAKQLFFGGSYSELTAEDLERAIQAVSTDLRQGRIYFDANEKELINRAGHYMLYGSEYLTAIAAHLPDYKDYRQVLKTRGEPTLFICDVPIKLVSDRILKEFAGVALQSVFAELLNSPEHELSLNHGSAMYVRAPLDPVHIVGHYHPIVTYDPLLYWR